MNPTYMQRGTGKKNIQLHTQITSNDGMGVRYHNMACGTEDRKVIN